MKTSGYFFALQSAAFSGTVITTLRVDIIIIPILQMEKLRLRLNNLSTLQVVELVYKPRQATSRAPVLSNVK